jgi:hypothetical protein
MPVKKTSREGFYRVCYDEVDDDAIAFPFKGLKQQAAAYAEAMRVVLYREEKRKRMVKVTLHYVTTELVYHTNTEGNDDNHH